MSGGAAWLLAGTALLLWPPHAAARRRIRHAARSPHGSSRRGLQAVTAVAITAGAVAIVGVVAGAAVACLAAPVGVGVVARLDARPSRARASPDRRLALALDLAAAALRCGRPVASALDLAAPAAGDGAALRLAQVAGLLRLGAEPAEAWRSIADDDVLAPVAQTAARSADSGVRLARGLEQVAAELRDRIRAGAEAQAHRAGVFAMLPLGLCFLPAFVCLGVVPVVVGIARGITSGLP